MYKHFSRSLYCISNYVHMMSKIQAPNPVLFFLETTTKPDSRIWTCAKWLVINLTDMWVVLLNYLPSTTLPPWALDWLMMRKLLSVLLSICSCGRKEVVKQTSCCLCTWLPDGYSQIIRSYVFGPTGFWTMAPLHYAAKFDPFLSLDCAPTPSTLAQSKERKGSNFAFWQPCLCTGK